ncbi:MAG: cbb3-type cytochrome c oxidase subunit I [Thermoplasmata archaeon]
MTDPTNAPPSVDRGDLPEPVFQKPPILTRVLDEAEAKIREPLARWKFFQRLFLLDRDWMTRITMLMLIGAMVWGVIGGLDATGFQSQAYAYSTTGTITLTNQEIYSSVTLHGLRMLFGFAQQLEMALFGLLAINAMGVKPRHKWALYTSVGLINASIMLLEGPFYLWPTFNDNYFPSLGWTFTSPLGIQGQSAYVIGPLWFIGWYALAAAVLIWAGWMLVHFRDWFRTRPAGAAGRLPVSLLFILATVILIPLTYAPILVSTTWDVGTYYLGWALNPLVNQVIFWMFGHGIVYILFLIPVAALYLLIPILSKRPIYSYRFALVAAILFIVLTPLLGIHHLFLTALPTWSTYATMVISFLIIIPSAITFFSLWMTVKGVRRSQWEWNIVALFALLAFAGSIAGGLSGPDVATIGSDVDLHNSLFVLSHFHTITILGIVAGGYAVLYAVFPLLCGRAWISAWLARVHFVATAIGGIIIVLCFEELGALGILRRQVLFPNVPAVDMYNVILMAGIVIILVGQLFFVLNGFLTAYRGRPLATTGLSFDEAIRTAARSTYPRPTVPIHDVPVERKTSRARRERVEKIWVGSVMVLVIIVLAAATPQAFSVTQGITSAANAPAGSEFVTLTGQPYYWTVNETGPIHGTFDNAIVAYAGQWISINASATGATQSLYIPFRSLPVVNVQVVPGSTSYSLFQAPSTPGVYGAPDGEFDGPWFGQDAAALIVLPTGAVSDLSAFQSAGGLGDIYNPPVMTAASASLVGDGEGLFNHSIPGPTLYSAAGVVSFSWEVPLSSIGINNYLVNVTSNDKNAQQQYVVDHNYILPYAVGIYQINATRGLVPMLVQPSLTINHVVNESASLASGVYLYGLISPVSYSYDPDGQSNGSTGSQLGEVMGLWGVLWVGP